MRKVVRTACFYAKIWASVAMARGIRWILVAICGWCAVFTGLAPANVLAAEVNVSAKAALLLDMQTGAVLAEKQGYQELPPASTTKILTALLMLDIAPEERLVSVSPTAASVGESNIGLQSGEQFKLGELLDAALLKSANDACFAIAEGAVGSEPLFVRLMNIKADALGAGGAVLKNTNGLPAEGHSLSCYDLAILARSAMQNPAFQSRVGSRYGKMEGGSYNRDLKNTNKLLTMNEYVTGIKTGTTNAAGGCLVSSMERDGRSVIAVVLHSGDRYADSLRLLNMGIDNFQNRTLIRRGEPLGSFYIPEASVQIPAVAAAELTVTLPKDLPEDAISTEYVWKPADKLMTIEQGGLLGTLTVYYQNEPLGAVNLLAGAAYQPTGAQKLFSALGDGLRGLLSAAFGG